MQKLSTIHTIAPQAEMFEMQSWSDLVAAAPPQLAAATGLAVQSVGGSVCVVAPGIPSTEFNRSVGLGVSRPATMDDVDAVLGFYRDRDVPAAWIQLLDGAQPAPLGSWLSQKGATDTGGRWVVLEHEGRVPATGSAGLRIEEIGRNHAEEAGAVFRAGYGLPPAFDPWIAGLVGRANWRSYAAFDGTRIIGVAFLYRIGERAAMLGAATLPEARRKGAQTGLMTRRLSDAYADGVKIVQSHTWLPGPGGKNSSLNNMRRSGFVDRHQRLNYLVGPAGR